MQVGITSTLLLDIRKTKHLANIVHLWSFNKKERKRKERTKEKEKKEKEEERKKKEKEEKNPLRCTR
jgi:hypothetical protein